MRARAWLLEVSVAIQKLYLDWGRRQQRYDTARQGARARNDTAGSALRHGASALCAGGLGVVRVQCSRRLGQSVRIVHPTQF